jgi:hypothetical protein
MLRVRAAPADYTLTSFGGGGASGQGSVFLGNLHWAPQIPVVSLCPNRDVYWLEISRRDWAEYIEQLNENESDNIARLAKLRDEAKSRVWAEVQRALGFLRVAGDDLYGVEVWVELANYAVDEPDGAPDE